MNHEHVPHKGQRIAYHFDWSFRKEAFLWSNNMRSGVNFYPYATNFQRWMYRKGDFPILAKDDLGKDPYTNPFTYHLSTLASILANVINDTFYFSTSTDVLDATQAELQRIRLYNEQVIYTARFCEAAIKQLLFCTGIKKRYYEKAALGALLAFECRGCKASGKERHDVSLLGSLGHRYGLCLEFEHCLLDHLRIVNRRRNIEAAHAETETFQVSTAEEVRKKLFEDSRELGSELAHMLTHIKDLEQRMEIEITQYLECGLKRWVASYAREGKGPII